MTWTTIDELNRLAGSEGDMDIEMPVKRIDLRSAVDVIQTARVILDDVDENLRDLGDCDHSVGICYCGLVTNRDNLAIALHHFYMDGPLEVPAPIGDDGIPALGAGAKDRPMPAIMKETACREWVRKAVRLMHDRLSDRPTTEWLVEEATDEVLGPIGRE